MIIAVDGPAASGKGTIARRLSDDLNFAYLDTGNIYRGIALNLIDSGGDVANDHDCLNASRNLDLTKFSEEELRKEETGIIASKVAFKPLVRSSVLEFQRFFARNPGDGFGGAVLDGRDIGTVVCPNAEKKIFVTADIEIRVQRRLKELNEKGLRVIESRVRTDLVLRDERDSSRSVAPLKPAKDAWILDTSNMDVDQAFSAALKYIRS